MWHSQSWLCVPGATSPGGGRAGSGGTHSRSPSASIPSARARQGRERAAYWPAAITLGMFFARSAALNAARSVARICRSAVWLEATCCASSWFT